MPPDIGNNRCEILGQLWTTIVGAFSLSFLDSLFQDEVAVPRTGDSTAHHNDISVTPHLHNPEALYGDPF